MLQRERRKINKFLSAIVCFLFMFSIVPITALADEVQAITTSIESSTELKVGQVYSGFKLVGKQTLDDGKLIINTFEHEKSGAKLTYLQNDDENKGFNILFRTLAEDNTGVNHIIEHSVLCGSEKFPVKDVFSSITLRAKFYNALTGDDMTCYPFISKYDKDFRGFMDIYLDAVFNPNVLKEENIMRREGWRYELDSKDDELKINGIVYNEMKGSYSDPDRILIKEVMKSLYSDTTYRNESGGYPTNIPELTYEHLKETYKKNYNPSNAHIVLYGKLDILDNLKFINDEYLSKLTRNDTNIELPIQKPLTQRKEVVAEYNVANGSSTENKSIMALNYVFGDVKDSKLYIVINTLPFVLLNAPQSTMQKELRNSGFTGTVEIQPLGLPQCGIGIVLKNFNENDKDKYEKIILDNINNVVKQGVNKDIIKSLLQKDDEGVVDHSNDCINYTVNIPIYMNYGLGISQFINENEMYNTLKQFLEKDEKLFEKLLEEKILNNKFASRVILNPHPGLEEEQNKQLKEKLAQYKNSLSEAEINELVKKTQEFKTWQDTPDSQEAIDSIPKPEIGQGDDTNQEQVKNEKDLNGVKLFHYPAETNGKAYANIYFNTKNIPQEKLDYLNLYSYLIANVDLKNCTKEEYIQKLIDDNISLNADITEHAKLDDSNDLSMNLSIKSNFSLSKVENALSLIKKAMLDMNLEDEKNIKQVIDNQISSMEKYLANDGSAISMQSVKGSYATFGDYDSIEYTAKFVAHLKNVRDNFDVEWPNVAAEIKDIQKSIFNKENTIMSVTCNDEAAKKFEKDVEGFINSLGNDKFVEKQYSFNKVKPNTAYINNEKVVYVAKGGNSKKYGYEYNGSSMVVNLILNEYLFNTVRMIGGAYGANALIDVDGSCIMYSYRDSNVKDTLKYYDESPKYLRELKITQDELNQYISQAISKIDLILESLSEVATVGRAHDNMYFLNMDLVNKFQTMKKEALKTTPDDIKAFADVLEKVLAENNYSVSGNRDTIMKNKELFKNIVDLSNSEVPVEPEEPSNPIEAFKSKAMRIEGVDRYETAANISSQIWEQADTAIICYGENYADALSAISLAKKYDAPILYTASEKLDGKTTETLKKLKVKNVIIIGGEGVVSKNVENTIVDMGITTERIFGKDRYETSLKVAQKLGDVDGLVLATSKDFIPGLSVASYAANNNMAVLLVDNDHISPEARAYIKAQNIKEVYYAGDEKSIGKNITDILPNGKRLDDENRYENNIQILDRFSKNMNYENVFIVTGKDFADALCTAAVAAKLNAPVIFIDDEIENATSEYLKYVVFDSGYFIIVGSEGGVSSEVLLQHFE